MDFVVGVPWTMNKYDSIWVIMDRLTKYAHFLPINIKYSLEKMTGLYIKEIERTRWVSSSVLDKDPRFTFWF